MKIEDLTLENLDSDINVHCDMFHFIGAAIHFSVKISVSIRA